MSAAEAAADELLLRVGREWREHIAPFWLAHAPDDDHGGFRGWVGNDLRVDEDAPKGVVLTARILWTFSRAYALDRDPAHLRMAERAYADLTGRFLDPRHGGVFWTLDGRGRPLDRRKRTYAQAFAVYGLAEYAAAAGDRAALAAAMTLFELLEARCRDREHDGYFETFEADWSLAAEQRLSEVDRDDAKSMNAHLHVLEAYAALARASGDPRVTARLGDVLRLMLDRVVDPGTGHLRTFFDARWAPTSRVVSFGHDVEASWLLCEAAEVPDDTDMTARVREVALRMASAVADEGLAADGSLLYEAEGGRVVDDRHWWVQAEAVVGFLNAWQLGGGRRFLDAAIAAWGFVERRLVDRERGEWFWKVSRDGAVASELPKVSQWKCPYHNGRMCFEVRRRLGGEP